MGHETTKAAARGRSMQLEAEIRLKIMQHGLTVRAGSGLAGEPLQHQRRSHEHESSDKSSDYPRLPSVCRKRHRSTPRPLITRPRIMWPRITRPRITQLAPARPPRKPLRVKGLGDKLGYPQATFAPPSIFSQQP
jgi:hypothetical protein